MDNFSCRVEKLSPLAGAVSKNGKRQVVSKGIVPLARANGEPERKRRPQDRVLPGRAKKIFLLNLRITT